MHLLTFPCHVAYSVPNPALPVAPSNEHYGTRVPSERIYHQIPTIIFHTNAGDLPLPPRPLAKLPLPRTFPEFDDTLSPRRSPSVWSLARPWDPFLPSSMPRHAEIVPNREIVHQNRGGCVIERLAVERLVGPGSVLKEVESRVLPFIRVLTRLDIFGIWKDETGPDCYLLLNAAEELTSLPDLRSRLKRTFSSQDRAVEEVERLNHSIDVLDAMDQYAVRVALDACALLGGVELPNWPACLNFAGAWFEEAKRNLMEQPASYISQCRARDCERWGVPCWVESPKRQYSRFEVTPFDLPTSDRHAEGVHQQWLRQCPPERVRKSFLPTNPRRFDRFAPDCPLPSAENWDAVKSKIVALLDCDATPPLIFQQFNHAMGRLLGQAIWSGKQYEAQRHSDESFCWLKAREGAQEILHRGVIHASLEIPTTWGIPQLLVADKTGTERLVPFESDARGLAQPAVAAEAWFGVELVGYQAGQEEEAQRIASSYNALGYRFVQAPIQLKDAQGRTIPRSLYQIELLFKSRRQQQDVCREIRAALPSPTNISASPVDLDIGNDRLTQFCFKADPHYVNCLYSVSLSVQERQRLLQSAPQYPVPPATHSTPSDVRTSQELVYLWRLTHFSLFGYDNEYMPPGYVPGFADAAYAEKIAGNSSHAAASSSSQKPAADAVYRKPPTATPSPRTSLPIAELPLARLGEIVFAPSLPFPVEDVDRLRRLYLCLWAGKRRAPFTALIFPFPGSSYREMLAYIVRLVEESSKNGVVDFSYRMGPPNSSASIWDEKITLDARCRVKISMDPALVPEWDAARDVSRVEGYVTQCTQLPGLSRAQKRRKKQAEHKGKGKATAAEMETDMDVDMD